MAVLWNNGSGGAWETTANWTPTKPTGLDDALINVAAIGAQVYQVTVGATDSVNAVTVNTPKAELRIFPGGRLNVASSLDIMSGTFDLEGIMAGGILTQEAGGVFLGNGGTLSSVFLSGTLTIPNASGSVHIVNALTPVGGTGTINLTGDSSRLLIDDAKPVADLVINVGALSTTGIIDGPIGNNLPAMVLDGTSRIMQTAAGSSFLLAGTTVDNFATMTLGASQGNFSSSSEEFDNNGVIAVSVGEIGSFSNNVFKNIGSISVTSNGLLTISASSGSNTGVISVSNTGQVTLQQPMLGSGTIQLSSGGTLDAQNVIGTVQFQDGAAELVKLRAPGAFTGTLAGFSGTDKIDLVRINANQVLFNANTLTVRNSGAPVASLVIPGNFASNGFITVPDGASGTFIELVAACFAEGTAILSAHGPVPVERLRAGDAVVAVRSGRLAPIVWVGYRRVACDAHPAPFEVWPVRVRRDAFGPGMPVRDLLLSPDHSVFVEEVLIPVRDLVNGTSIVQERMASVTYYHVELARHDVVLAEGLPAESYLDTGNRGAFENGGGAVALRADFTARIWDRAACAMMVRGGETWERVRNALANAVSQTHKVRSETNR